MTDRMVRRLGGVASMRLRITVLASLVTAVAVALAGWLLIRAVEDTQLQRLRDRAEESVDTVVARLESGTTWDAALVDLSAVVFITDGTGSCVASNPAGGATVMRCAEGRAGTGTVSLPDPPTLESRLDEPAEDVASVDRVTSSDEPIFALRGSEGDETMTRSVDSELYGRLSVTSVAPADDVARGIASVGKALWVLFPGLVGIVAVAAWWLAGHTLRPVESIRLEVEGIKGSSIHRRVPEPGSDDEIGRLARTMNAMLDRLERSAQRQHQFVSDASHELRSPVTAIRTDLEVALQEGDRADWPAVARAVLAEEARLEAVLGDLLVLASDDESGPATATQAATVDIASLAADEVARRRTVPVSIGTTGQFPPERPLVAGVSSRLQRALSNLVDNACRHADETVVITVDGDGDRVRIHVDDDGPGVAAADRDRIFERFTRLDEGRGRDHGGAGLGLAVVRSIVNRHGGTVAAKESPIGGARFTVDLPRLTAPSSVEPH